MPNRPPYRAGPPWLTVVLVALVLVWIILPTAYVVLMVAGDPVPPPPINVLGLVSLSTATLCALIGKCMYVLLAALAPAGVAGTDNVIAFELGRKAAERARQD